MPSLQIAHGTILDPGQQLNQPADLLLRDGKTAAACFGLSTLVDEFIVCCRFNFCRSR